MRLMIRVKKVPERWVPERKLLVGCMLKAERYGPYPPTEAYRQRYAELVGTDGPKEPPVNGFYLIEKSELLRALKEAGHELTAFRMKKADENLPFGAGECPTVLLMSDVEVEEIPQ